MSEPVIRHVPGDDLGALEVWAGEVRVGSVNVERNANGKAFVPRYEAFGDFVNQAHKILKETA